MRTKGDGRGRFGGGKKGTPNKVTSSLREWVNALIDSNREQIESDLKELEPKDRLMVLERLLSYVLPKMQNVDTSLNFDGLTDEQLNKAVKQLVKEVNRDARKSVKNNLTI